MERDPLLRIEDVMVEFPAGRGRRVSAVCGVSLQLARGETLGLVGESGCGKSSLARSVMQLPPPTSGKIFLKETELTALPARELRILRSSFQMIFQDPVSSLNPFRCVGESIEEPLRSARTGVKQRRMEAWAMMSAVGLDPGHYYGSYPQQLSGGQCQRVSIARALMTKPDLLVCDEPVSSLDVSVQAQILNLLREMRDRFGLGMLFIAHDLTVVRNICHRVAVMYLGVLCEVAPCAELYRAPAHPYTAALLAAVPRPDPLQLPQTPELLSGELPSPLAPPAAAGSEPAARARRAAVARSPLGCGRWQKGTGWRAISPFPGTLPVPYGSTLQP